MRTMAVRPPKIGSLHHVAVTVHNLNEAVVFYGMVLGFHELDTPDTARKNGIRWYDVGDGRALHIVESSDPIAENRAHFAITVDDIDGWRIFLEERGIELIPPRIDVYNAKRFFLRDPSGNLLEFVKWL